MSTTTMIDGTTTATNASRVRPTRLLWCGVAAGPLYMTVGMMQAMLRDGFDVRRHALSLLSNGTWGWVQIANFVVSGLLVLAAAIGMRDALRSGRGNVAVPILLGIYGVSLLAAGVFVADPGLGFPPDAVAPKAGTMTLHGLLHFASGGVGFMALIGACMVTAWRLGRHGRRGWAIYSVATGVLFLAGFMGVASGTRHPAVIIAFYVAVTIAWTWVSLVSFHVRRLLR